MVISQEADFSKYNYLKPPAVDTWGVVMRKGSPLSAKETVQTDGLLESPIIASRQDIREDLPERFAEKINIAAGILVREGLGYAVTFDKPTGPDSELCFQP